MNTVDLRHTRRVLLQWLATLAVLCASEVAMAGILDMFSGDGPVLKQRTRVGAQGLAVVGDFRVAKTCGYDFDLRLLHKHGQMHELDSLLSGDTFPVPVKVRVSREGGVGATDVQFENAPKASGHGAEMTIFNLGHASLEKGRYRVQLTSSAAPQLADVDIDFVIQIRPKTSCP